VGTTWRCQVSYDDAHIGSHKVMLSYDLLVYYSLTYRLLSEVSCETPCIMHEFEYVYAIRLF